MASRTHRDAELAALRRWKAEAMQVARVWEQVWEAAGCPGQLGESKAEAVLALFRQRED